RPLHGRGTAPLPRLRALRGGGARRMITRSHSAGGTASSAVYSACGTFRYLLTREWDPAAPRLLFVMLNPSTASELRNDPTVARCETRARALRQGAFRVA